MEEKKNKFGLVSIILAVVGLLLIFCFVGVIPAVLSIIFGIICLAKKPDGTQKALSIIGIILSVLAFILLFTVGSMFSFIGSEVDENNNTSPNSPSQQEQQITNPKKLEATDVEMVKENAYSTYIKGTVKNTTGKELKYVQIEFNLYDSSGAQVGSTLANINNLEKEGVWSFKAYVYPDTSTSFKIKEITSW